MRKNLNVFIGILIGIICFSIWIYLIDFNEFVGYFKTMNLKFALIFSFFYVFAYFLRSLRWRLILKPVTKIDKMESFYIFMAGMLLNYLIPVRAGEIVKSIILKKNRAIPIAKTLPSIFIDKLADLFPIVVILTLIPLISINLSKELFSLILIIFFIYFAFLLFMFFSVNHRTLAIKITDKILFLIPKKFRVRLEDFFLNFVDGLSIMKGRFFDNFIVYLLTFLAVLSEALYVFAVFKTFGANISFVKIVFGYTLMNLTYILPTPPAQIGSNQLMWVLIFSFALGIDKNLTGAAIAFSHILTSVWIFLLGSISFSVIGIKLKDSFKISD